MAGRRVVVTGVGVASALGCDVETFWKRLVRGDSGVVALTDPDLAPLPIRIGALVQGYVASEYFEVKEVRRTSRASQLAVVAATQAVKQARLLAGRPDVIVADIAFAGAAAMSTRPRAARPPLIAVGVVPLVLSDPDVAPFGTARSPRRGRKASASSKRC